MVLMQALVAAGMGVTTIPGLALRSHQVPGITATEIRGSTRRVYAATYGAPPDPPATAALIIALQQASHALARADTRRPALPRRRNRPLGHAADMASYADKRAMRVTGLPRPSLSRRVASH